MLPTAVVNSTPLECNPCQGECGHGQNKNNGFDMWNSSSNNNNIPDGGFGSSNQRGFGNDWVNKHCTVTAVDPILLYFPYILLVMASAIILFERGFLK